MISFIAPFQFAMPATTERRGLRIQKQVAVSPPEADGSVVVEWQDMATFPGPLAKAIELALNGFGDETNCRILDVNTVVWPPKGDA